MTKPSEPPENKPRNANDTPANDRTQACEIYQKLREYDPVAHAECIAKDARSVPEIALGAQLVKTSLVNQALTAMGDSILGTEADNYLRLAFDLGFEEALTLKYIKHRKYHRSDEAESVEECLHVLGHRGQGLILVFDTYSFEDLPGVQVHVNASQLYYAWRPNTDPIPPHILGSGRWESEHRPHWRFSYNNQQPDDMYWFGRHDCREALCFGIQQLANNGKFFAIWPKQRHIPHIDLCHCQDWRDLESISYPAKLDETDRIRRQRMAMLPNWTQQIINWP